jgi:hypothetical protein
VTRLGRLDYGGSVHLARRPFGGVLLGVVVALAPRVARAQDLGPTPHAPGALGLRVGAESVWASFDVEGARGNFAGVSGRFDWRASEAVTLRVLVPVYSLSLDGSPSRVGVGDSELRLRVRVYDTHPWRVLAGIADGLPTGSTSLGLGQGASQLTPYVTAGYRVGSLVVYANLADAVTVRSSDKAAPVDYVDRSTDHEARGTLGAIFEVGEHLYGAAFTTGTAVLVPGSTSALATAGAAVGVLPASMLKLLLGGEVPVAGEHRFDVKVFFDAYVFF